LIDDFSKLGGLGAFVDLFVFILISLEVGYRVGCNHSKKNPELVFEGLNPKRFTIPSEQFNRRNFHGKDIFIERYGGAAVGVCADAADSRRRRDGSDHVQRWDHLQRHRQGCMQRPRWCPEGRPDIDDDCRSGSGGSAGRTGDGWRPNHLQGRHDLICHGQGCVQRSWRCAKSDHFGRPACRCCSRSRTCTGDDRREVDSDRDEVGADGDGWQRRPDRCDR
jgi:hypothetical protein